jgi:hypothetical protein
MAVGRNTGQGGAVREAVAIRPAAAWCMATLLMPGTMQGATAFERDARGFGHTTGIWVA